ncbi:MAG: adenylosuccinate synthase [Anaerolineae bacterium]|jgi:adenylosuccinate synthase
MSVTIVLGAQWGDEGKGKITDHLAERADMVVRYQGGTNAGHTIVSGGRVLKLHQVPSGITRPNVAAVMGHGMVITPPALLEELDELASQGVDTRNLHISSSAHLVMPYHLVLDGLQEEQRGAQALGTTKRGIGPAYADKYQRRGLRVQDLVDRDRFVRQLEGVLPSVNAELRGVYGHPGFTVDEIVAEYGPCAEAMAPYVTDTASLIHQYLAANKSILLEGAQATMLDIDYGTYPFVTSSSPTAGGACQGSGINPRQIDEIVGVVKVYTSRVGTGPFPTELVDSTGDWIVERGHEYGTTTGRRRRCGWIDTVSLRYAARVNGFTGLALTRLDILTGLQELRLCTHYRLPDGTVVDTYPQDAQVLDSVTAVYESMPGWSGDLSEVRTVEDLPAAAQAYCQRISELVGVPIALISVGAEREDLIALRSPI